MQDIGLPQAEPRVGIRGNGQDIPVYSTNTKLDVVGSMPHYTDAFIQLATTPNALSTISNQAMTYASNSLMDKWGYELGQNPHGNLLPAITNADQRLHEVYNQQAEATLGLQANKILLQSQAELEKQNKLTPALLKTYADNVMKGYQSLLENAPDAVKGNLQNSMQSTLLRSTANLNSKMVTQQKQDARDQAAVFNQTQAKNMYESAMAGDFEAAQKIRDSQIANVEQLQNSGLISAKDAITYKDSAEKAFLVGKYSHEAMLAQSQDKLEQYLSDFASHKPDDMTYLQWQEVGKEVLANVGQIDSLKRRDQSLVSAEFELAIVEDRVTTQTIEEIRNKLTPEQFTRSMIKFAQAKNAKQSMEKTTADIASVWNNPVAFASLQNKDINATFNGLVDAFKRNQTNQGKAEPSDIEAKIHVVNSAGGVVPQFTKEVNNMLSSGNPVLVEQAKHAYTILGQLKLPISQQAQDMLYSYNSQIAQGKSEEEAAIVAKEMTAPLSSEQEKIVQTQWKDFSKLHRLNEYRGKLNLAKDLLGIPYFSDIPNMPAVVQQANDAFEANFKRLRNVDAARSMTEANLAQVYGVTHVNGRKEFTYLPIEKFLQIDDAAGIIQNDMAKQTITQLEATKQAYDEKRLPYYYEVENRASIEEGLQANNEIAELHRTKQTKPFEYVEKLVALQQKIKMVTANKPVKVTQVFRDGTKKEFELSMQASENLGLGQNPNTPITGAYDVVLRSKEGRLEPIIGVDSASRGRIVYRPNLEQIQKQYFALHGLQSNPGDLKEAKDKFLANRKARAEYQPPTHLLF